MNEKINLKELEQKTYKEFLIDGITELFLGGILLFMPTLMISPVFVAFVPVLISLLRSGRQLALAAEVKAFRSSKKRTEYNQLKMKPLDYVVTFVALLILIGGIYGAVYLGMGAI